MVADRGIELRTRLCFRLVRTVDPRGYEDLKSAREMLYLDTNTTRDYSSIAHRLIAVAIAHECTVAR